MNRIKAISNLIETCQCVYDVGSDHAHLAISLLKDKKAKQVVNIEVANGPLKAGLNNLSKNHLTTKTLNVENNGLKDISKKVFAQPNFICIAGMGGNNIIDILTNKDIKLNKDIKYILEANTEIDLLRKWLFNNDWNIICEQTICDRNKYYQIMIVQEGNGAKDINIFEAHFGFKNKQLDLDCWTDYLKFVNKKIISKKLDEFNPTYKVLKKEIEEIIK